MNNERTTLAALADERASEKTVTLTIDGVSVNVADGATILDAAEEAGIRIPRCASCAT